jgi:hypothetical protein
MFIKNITPDLSLPIRPRRRKDQCRSDQFMMFTNGWVNLGTFDGIGINEMKPDRNPAS